MLSHHSSRWVSKQIEQPVLQIVAIQCIQWSSECSLSAVLLMCGQVCVSLGPGSMSVWLQPAPANQFLPTTLPVITSDSLIMKYFYHQTSQYSAHPYQPSKCQPGVCCYQLSVESETVQISSIRAAFKAVKVEVSAKPLKMTSCKLKLKNCCSSLKFITKKSFENKNRRCKWPRGGDVKWWYFSRKRFIT